MARPNKQGLDYFPLDVDFLEDEKMLAISGEFAVKGEIIVLRLLCEIYRNGYFVEYSGLVKNKLARLGGLSGGLVDEVVKKLVEYNFFDGAIFREYNVLTSYGIQKRYLEAIKRRKDVNISQFWLLKKVNVDINSHSKRVNVDINSQIEREIEKESKIKKSSSSCIIQKDNKTTTTTTDFLFYKIFFFNDVKHIKQEIEAFKDYNLAKGTSVDDFSDDRKIAICKLWAKKVAKEKLANRPKKFYDYWAELFKVLEKCNATTEEKQNFLSERIVASNHQTTQGKKVVWLRITDEVEKVFKTYSKALQPIYEAYKNDILIQKIT